MAEIVRGIVRAYDAGSHSATVEVEGSQQAYVAGVPVSRGIAGAEVVAGRWCVVAWTGSFNPAEGMVVGIH